MLNHPIVGRLVCVALIACIAIPLGWMIFPNVDHMVGGLEFSAIEAVVSTTLGFGIYAAIFG
jgi:hypothetical protein